MPSLSHYSEKDLLYRIRHHDKDAFDEIYRRYNSRLRGYVLKYTKVPQVADDIVQDVFLKIWEIRETIDPEKYFSGYVFTITKHLVFKFFKSAAANTEVLDDILISIAANMPDQESRIEWKELRDGIHDAILLLPPKRKEVFLLCKEENLSYDDVAEKLGVSRNTIKEHMVLAMRSIKIYLKRQSLYLPEIITIALLLWP